MIEVVIVIKLNVCFDVEYKTINKNCVVHIFNIFGSLILNFLKYVVF